jgi:hypothetical protein
MHTPAATMIDSAAAIGQKRAFMQSRQTIDQTSPDDMKNFTRHKDCAKISVTLRGKFPGGN